MIHAPPLVFTNHGMKRTKNILLKKSKLRKSLTTNLWNFLTKDRRFSKPPNAPSNRPIFIIHKAMPKYAHPGEIVIKKFIPTKRFEPGKTYKQLLDENIISKSNKTFIVVDSFKDVPAGKIVSLVTPPGEGDSSIQTFEAAGEKMLILIHNTTPVNITDIDKRACIVKNDLEKTAIDNFSKSIMGTPGRSIENEQNNSDREELTLTCPGCEVDLIEAGIEYSVDITEIKRMILNQYGEHVDTDHINSDPSSEEYNYRCADCGEELGHNIISQLS